MIDIRTLRPSHQALHILKNRSVFTRQDLINAMPEGSSAADQDDIMRSIEAVELNNGKFSTQRIIHAERSIVESAIGRQEETAHLVDPETVERMIQEKADSGKPMRQEQADSVRHATGKGGVSVIEGAAGVGKSFSLGVARQSFEAQGMNTIGIAPAGSAAQELEASSGIPSMTSHRFLNQIDKGASLSSNDVIFFDEAGTADSMMLARVTNVAHESGAKLILVGDSKQLESIASGNLLSDVGDQIGRAEMTNIARQKDPEKAEIGRNFYQGKGAEAIAKAESLGMVHTHKNDSEMNDQIAERYLELSEKGSVAVLANTNLNVDSLNKAVTEKLLKKGKLDSSTAHDVDLADRNDNPITRTLYKDHKVMFRSNDASLGVANGTLGTVKGFEDGAMQIEIENSAGEMETIGVDPAEYQNVEPAYAMTTFKSQGKTFDHAIYKADRMTDARSAYVSSTRAREGTEIFMDENDKEVITQRASTFSTKDTTISAMSDEDMVAMASSAPASSAAVKKSKQTDLKAASAVADKAVLGSAMDDLIDAKEFRDIVRKDKDKEAEKAAEKVNTSSDSDGGQAQERGDKASSQAPQKPKKAAVKEDARLREMMIARERNLQEAGGAVVSLGQSRTDYLQGLKNEFGRPSDSRSIYDRKMEDFEDQPERARRFKDYHDYTQQGRDRTIAQMTNGQNRTDRLVSAQQMNENLDSRMNADRRVATYDRVIEKRAKELGMSQSDLKNAEQKAEQEFKQTGSMTSKQILSPMERAKYGISLQEAKMQEDRTELERLTSEGLENTPAYEDTLERLEQKREAMGLSSPEEEKIQEEDRIQEEEKSQEKNPDLEENHSEKENRDLEDDQIREEDQEQVQDQEKASLENTQIQKEEQIQQEERERLEIEKKTREETYDKQNGYGFGQSMMNYKRGKEQFVAEAEELSQEEIKKQMMPDPDPELTEVMNQDLEQEPDLSKEIEQSMEEEIIQSEIEVDDELEIDDGLEVEKQIEVENEIEVEQQIEAEVEQKVEIDAGLEVEQQIEIDAGLEIEPKVEVDTGTELESQSEAEKSVEVEQEVELQAKAEKEDETDPDSLPEEDLELDQTQELKQDAQKKDNRFEQYGGLDPEMMMDMIDIGDEIERDREERKKEEERELSGNREDELENENENDKSMNR